jgi:phosphatidylethanolamine-binding protein (PEBP) family uncharacterized protein
VGSQHRYIFNAYALNLAPDLPAGMDSSSFSAAIKNHILGRAHIGVIFLHQ